MPIHPKLIIEQILLSFEGRVDELTKLKSSLNICLEAVKILESHLKEIDETSKLKTDPKSKDLISVLSPDILFTVCEFLNNKQVLRFGPLNKSLFVGLMGCPLVVGEREPLKYLNELSKLRINQVTISSRSVSCDCTASRFVHLMSREFPGQMALCPLEYSKVSSKYQFSPTLSELKNLGYYQPWTISEISLTKSMSSQNIDRIIGMKHILRLKSLTISGPIMFRSFLHANNDFSSIVSNLRCLTITSSTASFNIETLKSLILLQGLFFNHCLNIEGNIAMITQCLPDLKQIVLNNVPNIQGNISTLTCLGQLNEITIVDSKNIHGNLFSFSNLIKLKKLRLVDCYNIVGDLSSLSALFRLELMEFINMKRITGDIQHLSLLSCLWSLMMRSSIVEGNISVLSSLAKLEYLNLLDIKVAGDIGALINNLNLKELCLDHTKVVGNIEALSILTKLKILSLAHTTVFGNINTLSSLTALNELNLSNTSVYGNTSSFSHHYLDEFLVDSTQVVDDYEVGNDDSMSD